MKVIFRKFKKDGDIIAFLPESKERDGYMLSYMHVGQHAIADYDGLIKDTVLATPGEMASLHAELSSIYDEPLKVIKRKPK